MKRAFGLSSEEQAAIAEHLEKVGAKRLPPTAPGELTALQLRELAEYGKRGRKARKPGWSSR